MIKEKINNALNKIKYGEESNLPFKDGYIEFTRCDLADHIGSERIRGLPCAVFIQGIALILFVQLRILSVDGSLLVRDKIPGTRRLPRLLHSVSTVILPVVVTELIDCACQRRVSFAVAMVVIRRLLREEELDHIHDRLFLRGEGGRLLRLHVELMHRLIESVALRSLCLLRRVFPFREFNGVGLAVCFDGL